MPVTGIFSAAGNEISQQHYADADDQFQRFFHLYSFLPALFAFRDLFGSPGFFNRFRFYGYLQYFSI